MRQVGRGIALAVIGAVAAGMAVSQAPPPRTGGAASPAPGGGGPQRFGATTFAEVCASCHGANLEGGRGPALTDALLSQRSDAQLHAAIANGFPDAGMPAFKDVYSDDQIFQIAAFVRTRAAELKGKPVFVADPQGQVVRSGGQAVRLAVVARGLDTPWGLAFLPDGRLLVTERPGRMRIIDKSGRLLPAPVKNTPEVWVQQDAGMFDVAPHPDYARNGWIYLSYAEKLAGAPVPPPPAAGQRPQFPPSMTVIVRGRINARNEWVDQQLLFRAPAALYTSSGSHYGSRFLFDHKGHVFFTLGERGDMKNAQDLSNPLGKIHRINEDGSVPADNPFVGRAGAVATIWSYGHRNPEGLATDPATGLMWETEHGPTGGDELNLIERGGNYGWGVASMGVQPGITLRSAPGMIDPVAYYTPTLAPSGIHFYTGRRYPAWRGQLFVAGLAGQQLRRVEVAGRTVRAQEPVFQQFGRTRAVATGPDGLMYVLLQQPTGRATGTLLSDPTPGLVIRLDPAK